MFQQEREQVIHYGHPFEYEDQVLMVFFTMMSVRRITAFKAQHRWLMHHLHLAIELGFEQIPMRTTLSRRYKALYPILHKLFICFKSNEYQQIRHIERPIYLSEWD